MQSQISTPMQSRVPALAVQFDKSFYIMPVRAPNTTQDEVERLQRLSHVRQIDVGTVASCSVKANTGHKAFDDKTNKNYFGVGNVSANTMVGQYVRSRYETQCNGFNFDNGDLQNTDLTWFRKVRGFRAVDTFVRTHGRFNYETCIAYGIFHWRGKERVIHGALVTDSMERLVRTFERHQLGLAVNSKSSNVLAWAVMQLTDQRLAERETVWMRH